MNSSIKTAFLEVSPENAMTLLARNTANRPINSFHVYQLSQAMQRGEWRVNGDSIRISQSGVLLDGQHRLLAIVNSGITLPCLIVENLPDDSFVTIDQGSKTRGAADVLAIDGEGNYTLLSSASRAAYLHHFTGNPFSTSRAVQPSIDQLRSFINSNGEIRHSVSETKKYGYITKKIPPSVVAFCHFQFSKKCTNKATEFFDLLDSGTGLENGSPILLLRDRLSDSSQATTLNKFYKAALTFKAFKFFLDDATVKNLRVRLDGDAPEKNLFII